MVQPYISTDRPLYNPGKETLMSTDTNWKIARNEAVVRAFLKGWDDLDVDACMAQCTDEMCYLNQPLEAIRGKANVRKMIASNLRPGQTRRV